MGRVPIVFVCRCDSNTLPRHGWSRCVRGEGGGGGVRGPLLCCGGGVPLGVLTFCARLGNCPAKWKPREIGIEASEHAVDALLRFVVNLTCLRVDGLL